MVRIIIVAALMIAVLGGTNYYIAYRVYQGIASVLPKMCFGIVLAVFAALTVLMILGFVRSMLPLPSGIKHILGAASSWWMGIFIYLLLFTVAVDLVILLCRMCGVSFLNNPGLRSIALVLVLALTSATVAYGAAHARQIKHISYEVQLEGKTDISDMNIVMISDLHLGALGSESRLEKIVREINGLKPDLVCVAGDFFDTDFMEIKDPDQAAATLKGIKSTYGTYVCLGNHDSGETVEEMKAFLQACHMQVLNDEYVVIDERLILAGRLDAFPIGGYGDMSRKELSSFLPGANNDLPVIIMDHNPANVDSYTKEADLILSGHTHKGQIFPGNLITGLMYAVDHGHYQKDANSPHVIVTSGVGYWGMPLRIGTDCEIVSIRCKN